MLSQRTAQKLQMDSNARVMVYCAADSGLTQYTKSDIAFPHQVELKANLDEVKANLRGLKNRPGTTQPADVTNYIRKKPDYPNNIVMTYALTQKVGAVMSLLIWWSIHLTVWLTCHRNSSRLPTSSDNIRLRISSRS
jgi:hypothetical protein